MMTNPRKWSGRNYRYNRLLPQPVILPRKVTVIRFLKKAPCKTEYAEFSYAVQPVVNKEENVSYIAARMITANGRVYQPLHEYELSRRFDSLTAADEAWSNGFETREDFFLPRTLIGLLLDEHLAEIVPENPAKPAANPTE